MPHTPQPSGYFSPGFVAKQMRHAEEAVTDSPLLTPGEGLCAEQHWVTGSPRLPTHRTVYPGERRPEVHPEELQKALEKELRPTTEQKDSIRDNIEIKDFAYAHEAASTGPNSTESTHTIDPHTTAPISGSTSTPQHASASADLNPTPAASLSPVRMETGGEATSTPPKERRGHRRSPAKDIRMKHGVMTEVGACSAAPPTVS